MTKSSRTGLSRYLFFALILFSVACKDNGPSDKRITKLDSAANAAMAREIESGVSANLAEGLALSLWAVDSLVSDPVSLDIDDFGRLYYTRTNRAKNSEFDIRGHQDWEIGSIQLKTVAEKRDFLHKVLDPSLSDKNQWLKDLNEDGSHDWRDMTVEQEEVYRLEDTNGDGLADVSQLVIRDFHTEVTDVQAPSSRTTVISL